MRTSSLWLQTNDQNRLYFRSSFKDHFDKKKSSNWKLFSHLIITFIVSTLFDKLYLSVNYTTNRWPNNLKFSWFFGRIILENKSKWWTVLMIELCCQLVGMHMFAFYFMCGRAHVKEIVYILSSKLAINPLLLNQF